MLQAFSFKKSQPSSWCSSLGILGTGVSHPHFLWQIFSVAECICFTKIQDGEIFTGAGTWVEFGSGGEVPIAYKTCQVSSWWVVKPAPWKGFRSNNKPWRNGKRFLPPPKPMEIFCKKIPTVLRCHWSKTMFQALKLLPLFIRSTIGSISPQQYAHLLHSSPQN